MADNTQVLRINIIGNDSQFSRTMSNVKSSISKTMKDVGKAVVIGGAAVSGAVGGMAWKFTEMGSDVEEMENKFNVVFKGMTGDVDAWAKEFGSAVGRNSNTIKGAVADFADLTQGMGLTKEESFALSKDVVTLSTDLASFNNVSDATATEALTKAIMGESEMAKQLGLDLSETTMRTSEFTLATGKNWDELTKAEKMEIRYKEAVKQSGNAIGDAERSTDSYAGQMKKLRAKLEETGQAIGKALLPYMTKLVEKAIEVIDKVVEFYHTLEDNGVIDRMKEKLINIKDKLLEFWNSLDKQAIWETFKQGAITVWNALTTLYNIVEKVANFIINNWSLIEPIVVGIVGAFLSFKVITAIMWAFNTVMAVVNGTIVITISTVGWIVIAIGALIAIGYALWKNWDKITAWVSKVWDKLKNKANEVAKGIGKFFGGMFDGAKQGIKNGINWIIDKINKLSTKINGITSKISFGGISVPKIPQVAKMARGGIVTGATQSIIGEAGSEAVVPLSNKAKVRPFAQAVASELSNSNNSQTIINVQNMQVRNEDDVKKIAQELNRLSKKTNRMKMGGVLV